MNYVSVKLQID